MAALAQKLSQAKAMNESEAGELYKTIIDSAANDADVITVGNFLIEAAQYDKALALADKIIDSNRQDAFGWSLRAMAFMMSGKLQEGISASRKAAGISKDPDIQAKYARCLSVAGELQEAEKICRKIMKDNPEHVPSILVMALIYFRAGKRDESATIINSVIKSVPDCAEALWLRGNMHATIRNPMAAIADAEAAIKIKPWFFDAHLLRINMFYIQAKPKEALALLEKTEAFSAGTRESDAVKSACYADLGMHKEAEKLINKWLAIFPNDTVLRNALGTAYFNQGRYEEAIIEHKKTSVSNPKAQENWMLLATDQIAARDYDGAVASLKQAEAINPSLPAVHSLKSTIYLIKGDNDGALKSIWMAIRLGQNEKSIWRRFAKTIQQVTFTAADPAIEADLIKCMTFVETDKTMMVNPILSYLLHVPAIMKTWQAAYSLAYEAFAAQVQKGGVIDAISNPLLILLLESTIVPSASVEKLLTSTRRALLDVIAGGGKVESNKLLPLLYALARQCYLGEYVYTVTEEEISKIKEIRAKFADNIEQINDSELLIMLCYASMKEMPELADLWDNLAKRSDALSALAKLEWLEPMEEAAIMPSIKSVTPISDEISKQVQAQYEQNPYPRWVELPRTMPYDFKASMINLFPQLQKDADKWNFPEKPSMLIAGCGTGRHPISTALQYKSASILAVDLSRASLAYAMRKAKQYNVPNLEFAQADILALPASGGKFDIIESVGVIHHMRDPMEGWQALYDMLNSGGILRLGLYSEIARSGIVACRKLIAERGYKSTDEDIRRCRQEIINLPADRIEHSVTCSRDFYSTSNCRDLIFHVQEHRFTIPMIKAAIEKFDLEFLGFNIDDNYFIQRYYQPMFPDDKYALSLDNWQKLEEAMPHTFLGMYNFCMRKK